MMAREPQSSPWPCSSSLLDSLHNGTLPAAPLPHPLQKALSWDSHLLSFGSGSTVRIQMRCLPSLPVF